MFAYKKIFSRPAHTFKAKWSSGWKLSNKVYPELGHIKPYRAALEEITKWYCE
jgi:hypothetical protein